MIKKKIEELINEQINVEMASAYLYMSMAAYCHSKNQVGMGRWFEVQFREEQDHAKILFNYLIQRNGRVQLKAIGSVPTEWDSVLQAFETSLAHEVKVTKLINDLFRVAHDEGDFATESMLQWFIDEQVEEEDNVQTIINSLKMIKDNGYGLYMLDKELGARTYTPASPLANSIL